MDGRSRLIVIQGPTAGGKSDLGLRLAERSGGEIVNADAAQWVREFDIGTAKPSADERARVRHHLIDELSPLEPTDAGRYVARAREVLREMRERGARPILVGGTGLYVRALTRGLVALPPRDDALRREYDRILREEGTDALFERLKRLAPEAERRIDRRNPPRLVRALEVLERTGRPIWEWQDEHRFAERPYDILSLRVDPAPEWLRARIEARARRMVEAGLLEETRSLLRRYPDRAPRLFGSIGYKEAISVLDGTLPPGELAPSIARATWRYARKQITWLKREPEAHPIDPARPESADELLRSFLETPSG